MKKSGLKVNDIRQFIDFCMAGDATLEKRNEFLDKEEYTLENQIKMLEDQLAFLCYEKWYYKASLEAGTEDVYFILGTNHVNPATKKQYEQELKKCNDIHELIDYRVNKIRDDENG